MNIKTIKRDLHAIAHRPQLDAEDALELEALAWEIRQRRKRP